MKGAKKACNLTGAGKVANHSVRKTSIGRLLDANVPEIFVAQHSGHKSLESLQSYKTANKDQMFRMSNILSGTHQPGNPSMPLVNTNTNAYDVNIGMLQQHRQITGQLLGGAYFAGECNFNIYYGEPGEPEEKRRKTGY